MKQEPGKRIVSKGEYFVNIGKRTTLSTFALGFLLAGGFMALLTLLLILELRRPDIDSQTLLDKGWLCTWTPPIGVASLLLLYLGVRALKEIKKVETGIPLTRANTANLPAPDSLVRPSQKPLQAQETVLLRAATETIQTQEELLRASGWQEKP